MAQTRAERLAEMETKTPVPERVWALRNVAGEMETKTPVPELVWALCDVVGEMETKTLVPEHVWVLHNAAGKRNHVLELHCSCTALLY